MGALKYHLLYTFLKVLVQFMKIIKSGEEKKANTTSITRHRRLSGFFPPAEPILLLWFLYIPRFAYV